MKICWENLEGMYLTKKGNFKKYAGVIWIIKICEKCGEEFFSQKRNEQKYCSLKCSSENNKGINNPFYGKKHSKEILNKIIKKGKNNYKWKGGYNGKNIPTYDLYSKQLFADEVKRNENDENILEVKCTYCGKFFIPKLYNVRNRIRAINGKTKHSSENRLYCSEGCKNECPIYNKKYLTLIKEDSIKNNNIIKLNREVQPELRQIVLKRDKYKCSKCGNTENLHCHHVEGIRWNPLESADIDMCITVCKSCHKKIHKIEGCKYNDMKCNYKG